MAMPPTPSFSDADVRDFMEFQKFKNVRSADAAPAADNGDNGSLQLTRREGGLGSSDYQAGVEEGIRRAQGQGQTQTQAQTTDPNAERFGVGVAIRTRVGNSDETEAQEWERAERAHGTGLRHARVMRATALASLQGLGKNKEAVARIVHDDYRDPGTARHIELMLARNEASSQRPVDGGILIPTETAEGFVEFYRPYSVLGQLGATFYDSGSGSLTLPRQTSGMNASYSFENQQITVGDTPEMDEVTWKTKRLTALYVTSIELLTRSNYAADRIFRNDLGKAMGQKMEHTAINGNGQSGSIMGLENHPDLTNVNIGGALINGTNLNLFNLALRSAYVPMADNVKWLFNEFHEYALKAVNVTDEGLLYQREMDEKKTLKGKPFLVSQNVGRANTTGKPSSIFYGDWSELWIVREGTMEIKASEHARFEKNQVVVRATDFHDIAPRDGRAICRSSGARTE